MTYEELQIEHDGISVTEMDLTDVSGLKGLYYNGCVAIEQRLPNKEKSCVLAEELGHHYTTVGNILDQSSVSNRKQELRARMWAYNRQIGLLGIIKSYEYGCRSLYDMAEYLEVTEEFLKDALERYRQKYGMYTVVDNYIIYFEPGLGVVKMN